jgi:hypothetical protein
MKTFLKNINKRIALINSIFFIFCMIAFQNCDEAVDALTCSGCPSTSPYGKSTSNSCYATMSDCTAALGSGCVYCN